MENDTVCLHCGVRMGEVHKPSCPKFIEQRFTHRLIETEDGFKIVETVLGTTVYENIHTFDRDNKMFMLQLEETLDINYGINIKSIEDGYSGRSI